MDIKKVSKLNLIIGQSSHQNHDRQFDDFYQTSPNSLVLFLNKMKEDNIIIDKNVWECACGQGHLVNVLTEYGYNVLQSDLIDRGCGYKIHDFLKTEKKYNGDILTNPPFKYQEKFFHKQIDTINIGNKVIFFLKIQFLEGKSRYELFKNYPPKYVYVHSGRQICQMNGDFQKYTSSQLCYCWFIWEKGNTSEPVLRWIN